MLNKAAVPALALLLLACATRQPGDPLKPGYNVFSKQQDVELGQQAAAEISKQVDVVDSQELQSYIRDLGARLATQTQAEDYPYKFTLINDDSINALARRSHFYSLRSTRCRRDRGTARRSAIP